MNNVCLEFGGGNHNFFADSGSLSWIFFYILEISVVLSHLYSPGGSTRRFEIPDRFWFPEWKTRNSQLGVSILAQWLSG